jgi:hypothetical protein
MLIYAIARRGQEGLEYYMPLDGGNDIGWTDDLGAAWVIEARGWAEVVRSVLMRHGHGNIFVYPHRP